MVLTQSERSPLTLQVECNILSVVPYVCRHVREQTTRDPSNSQLVVTVADYFGDIDLYVFLKYDTSMDYTYCKTKNIHSSLFLPSHKELPFQPVLNSQYNSICFLIDSLLHFRWCFIYFLRIYKEPPLYILVGITVNPHLSGHLHSQVDCQDNWISGYTSHFLYI